MIRRVRADELSPIAIVRPPRSTPDGADEPAHSDEAAVETAMATLFAEQHALAPDAIVRLVERELRRFQGAHEVRVRVHPDDAARLPEPALLAQHSGLPTTPTVEPDASLTPGGCSVIGLDADTGELEVDARVETRIARALAFARGALS